MTQVFPLQTISTPQVVTIPGGINGSANVFVGFTVPPSAGTVTIEFRQPGSAIWQPLQKAAAVSITTGEFAVRVDGDIAALRLTFAGLVGGTGPALWLTTNNVPVGLFTGLAAITTQGYVEANVKYGLQFYIQYALPQLAANTQHKISFTTGTKKVLIKARDLTALGQFVNIQIFKQPTVTPATGTAITVQNYNDDAPVATTVAVRGGVTAPSNGISWGDPQRLFGQQTVGSRSGQSLPPSGDRILKANSSYLVVISNTDSGGGSTADCDYFLTWYEGGTDLPL